ncbi:DUF397 domain-containing protein [Streptomyces sp. NPDC012474]|uniref:DUF397 domain-containing protein n=1 Tax=Streptomyces sp. NPDC012474 TaxID=3364836 RepID=UPI0036EAEF33
MGRTPAYARYACSTVVGGEWLYILRRLLLHRDFASRSTCRTRARSVSPRATTAISRRVGATAAAAAATAWKWPTATPVRDSKTPHGPKLVFRATAWAAFVENLKDETA